MSLFHAESMQNVSMQDGSMREARTGEFLFDKYETLSLFNGIHARANELAMIANRISSVIASTQSAPLPVDSHTQPRVWYSDCHVHCGDERVAMNHRPLLFSLYKALIDAPEQELPRQQLIHAIYPRAGDMDTSEQFRATAAHNLVKLVSRARELAIAHLNAHGNANTRWFVYDLRRGVWRLRENASSC